MLVEPMGPDRAAGVSGVRATSVEAGRHGA